jgi:hypothetical protein
MQAKARRVCIFAIAATATLVINPRSATAAVHSATWLGGTTILDKLEAADYDVFAGRPRLTKADAPRILWRTIAW